jgi:hypothetical protein
MSMGGMGGGGGGMSGGGGGGGGSFDRKEVKQLINKLEDKGKTAEQIQARVGKIGGKEGGITTKGQSFLNRYVSKNTPTISGGGSTTSANEGGGNDGGDFTDFGIGGGGVFETDDLLSTPEYNYLTAGFDVESSRLRAQADIEVAKLQKDALLGVAGIETKGKLDLQPIINAGLKDVENIRATSERDVANIAKASSMYGLIASAFG